MLTKKTDHQHGGSYYMSDEALLEHVTKEHEVPADEPWLLNEANRELLVTRHAQAHMGDSISF